MNNNKIYRFDSKSILLAIYIYIYMYVCVCVCNCAIHRKSEGYFYRFI